MKVFQKYTPLFDGKFWDVAYWSFTLVSPVTRAIKKRIRAHIKCLEDIVVLKYRSKETIITRRARCH